MRTDWPIEILLLHAVFPMAALQVIIVSCYLVFMNLVWERVTRVQAVVGAPLAIPLSFLLFFGSWTILASSFDPTAYVLPLVILLAGTWLIGIITGVITFACIRWRQRRY